MSEKIREITFLSELDNTMQPAFFAPASGSEPRPLVVALHTWSYSFDNGQKDKFFAHCAERNWHCIFPHFRGPNWLKDACGSDLVVSDLKSAVAYVKANYPVDETRVFLLGGSGGGHASLLMAGRHPELWSAVSSWCPISDVAKWHAQCSKFTNGNECYAEHIRQACGGDPQQDPAVFADAMYRSPVTYLAASRGKVIVDIGTGIHDGHTGSVPVSHTLEAFNLLAAEADRISEEDIEFMVKNEAVPAHLQFEGIDPAYGENKVLFRRESGMVRVTIFEGGHNLLTTTAFGFLDQQCGGKVPVWYSGEKAENNAGVLSR
ncbi:MAG: hypothetical protein E7057_03500 [Lentisphaerae bacterium]|nr:hypothetical protein [Lentisphaerota bacterium]